MYAYINDNLILQLCAPLSISSLEGLHKGPSIYSEGTDRIHPGPHGLKLPSADCREDLVQEFAPDVLTLRPFILTIVGFVAKTRWNRILGPHADKHNLISGGKMYRWPQ